MTNGSGTVQVFSAVTIPLPTVTPTASWTTTPTPTPPPTHAFLPSVFNGFTPPFTDDFSHPSSGWPIQDTDIYSLSYQNGTYRILVKQSGYVVYAGPDLSTTDFQMAVDAWTDTPASGSLGLYFAASSVGRYVFDVSPSAETYQVLERDYVNDVWLTIIPPTQNGAILPTGQTNHLRIVRTGSTVSFSINN